MKLQDLLKDLELGKVYTDKDRKPFKVNEETLNEFNKAHFLNLIKQEIESIKGQIAYSKDKVNYKGTPDWEKKEFKAVLKDKIKDLKNTEKHYKRVQKLKEGLDESWDSPQSYSSKEAQKVIDGAIRSYSKDLRKVQYRVVKDWMTKAKAGVIDYFDIVRGLQTGDITKAHPYETDFLHNVLLKDKIIDRFRKYFGGKKGKRERRK